MYYYNILLNNSISNNYKIEYNSLLFILKSLYINNMF